MRVLGWSGRNLFGYEQFDIDLSSLGRTVLLDGVNKDFASSSSNGAGKSSLIEALCWTLFGRTIRNVESRDGRDSVINNGDGGKGAEGRVNLLLGTENVAIRRYRRDRTSKNGVFIEVNGKDITGRYSKDSDKAICSLLGFNFDVFKRAVVIHSWATESFRSLNDRYLKYITERLVGMPEMDAVGKFVHSKTVSLSESITSLSTKIEMLDKSILDKQRDLDSVRKMEQDFADKRAEEIKLRKLQISASLEKLSNSRTGYLKSIKINEAEVERLISLISKANTKKDSEAETISKLESAHSDNEATVKMNKVMLRKYTDMKATSICPECNQAVGRDHIKNLVSLTDRAYNASKAQAAESLKALTSAKASHQKTQEHLFDILTRKTNLRQVIGSTLMHVNNCENSIRSLKEELAQLTEEDTVNPFKELVHSTKQELSKLKAELEDRQHSITVKERTKQYYDFWKRGFGPDGMRAYLLDAVTPDLNKLANIYLQELTDGTVSVELSTVSAKKDGTFADRFSVTIDNSIGSRYFAGNSDGEIACVDLAINFAMSDILESRLKDGFGLLYIDQAIDNVDPVRGEKALTLLSRRVDKKWCHNIGLPPKDHVFVITHREQFKDRLESTIFVEKENGICRRID